MKRFFHKVFNASAGAAVIGGLFFAAAAGAQKPGANLWGDADGNGIIEIPDLSVLGVALGNPAASDTLLYQAFPQSRFRQDLDGNGLMEIPDLSLLTSWLTGDYSSKPGNPDRLLLDSAALDVEIGDSVTLTAYALSPESAGSKVRAGFGVVFKISSQSQCQSAELLGYDPSGGSTIAWRSGAAFNYTAGPGAPENGRAKVRVRPAGCQFGQTITVEAYIPADAEAKTVGDRFPSRLSASANIQVTVTCTDLDHDGHGANCPEGPDCNDSDTTIYAAAMEIYGDGIDQDCDGRDPDGFYFNPYLQLGNQASAPQISDRMTVVWANATETIGQVLYGTSFPPVTVVPDPVPAQLHQVNLTGLTPDTKYYYQVIAGSSVGPVSSFRTAHLDLHKPFRFAYIGDTRTNHGIHLSIIDMMRGWKPLFYLHGGDMVEIGWDPSLWEIFFSIEQRLAAFAPLAPVIGNHDMGGYEAVVSVPINLNPLEQYYSWDYAGIHFVHTGTEYTGTEQDDALAADLAAAAAAYPSPRFIIAIMHRNAYSNSGHPGDENYPYSTIWGPVFEQSNMAIAIQAHCHLYERFEPIAGRVGLGTPPGNPQVIRNGLTYMTVGAGGAPLHPVVAPPGYGGYGTPPLNSLVAESNYQAMLIDVSGGTMHIRVMRPDSSMMDEFYVIRNVAPIANAGDDFSAPNNTKVTLDGSASSDLEDDPISYQWLQTGGTPVTLNNPNSATPDFTPETPDTYNFQLTVNDAIDTAIDSVTVIVTP